MEPVRVGTVRPATVFLALLRRDVRVAQRELPYFLLRTIMQPVMFIIVFGYLLPKMGFVRGTYSAALVPGVLALSLALAAVQSVTLPMVQDFGWSREIEDRLLAPIPIPLIAAEKIVMGVLQGVIAALVVLPVARVIMGPIPGLTLAHAGALALVTVIGASTFSALGLFIGSVIRPEQIGLMFSIIIAPMIFDFSFCAFSRKSASRVSTSSRLPAISPARTIETNSSSNSFGCLPSASASELPSLTAVRTSEIGVLSRTFVI